MPYKFSVVIAVYNTEEYLKDDCRMKDFYQSRVDDFLSIQTITTVSRQATY